jgi:hypothetical protein
MWLNEGFDTYMEGLVYEHFDSKEAYRKWRKKQVASVCSDTGINFYGSVHVPDSLDYNRIYSGRFTYDKGSMVVQMLRHRLGDSAFFTGIRSYLQANKYRYVSTQNLQQALEAASGDTLSAFFQRWLFRGDFPYFLICTTWRDPSGTLYISPIHIDNPYPEIPTIAHYDINGRDTIYSFPVYESGSWRFNSTSYIYEDSWYSPYNIDYVLLARFEICVAANRSKIEDANGLYPNPSSNALNITGLKSEAAYQITSVLGKAVQSGKAIPDKPISIQNLPSGTYILHVGDLNLRFVKM